LEVLDDDMKLAILEIFEPEELVSHFSPEERLRGLTAEELLRGLSEEKQDRLRELLERRPDA